MGRYAAIDLGTNTALLLVAEVNARSQIQPLCEEERIVRLGEGVDENRTLRETAMTRVLNALGEYVAIVQKWGVEKVAVSGTSALRDASNREVLLDRIRESLGLEVQILSGIREAELTYRGALSNKPNLRGRTSMVDIGGGSTEFVAGRGEEVVRSLSVDIGSVRLTERFIHHDPITASEFNNLQAFIEATLADGLQDWPWRPEHFVGVAGTVTTLAAMNLELEPYQPDAVDGTILTGAAVAQLIALLKTRTAAERRALRGLHPKRADVILAGAMILQQAMACLEKEEAVVSDRGLRYGLLLEAAASS